jgi:cobalt-zinc-cadmium efflux system membrane fusion protein
MKPPLKSLTSHIMNKQIIFIFWLLLASCHTEKEQAATETDTASPNSVTLTAVQIESAKIRTSAPLYRTISNTIKANGIIDVPPQNMISVSIPLGGYLKSTQLLPGMHVRKGMPIALIEDQQYIQLQQDYLTTKAKLEMAEAEYNRQRELNASQAASDKMMQQARAEFLSLRIMLSALAEKLRLININPGALSERNISRSTRLYAPADAYVAKVNVNIGRHVTPEDVLFELISPTDVHLKLKLFERDLAQLNVGQKLEAYTNGHPEQKYRCEIILISKDIAPDRTAEVHCHFEQYDKRLLPGMYMNAEIALEQREALCIPETAVVSADGKEYVFIQTTGNTFEMKEVAKGSLEGGWAEIRDGNLLQGRQIVTEGAYALLMSLKASKG